MLLLGDGDAVTGVRQQPGTTRGAEVQAAPGAICGKELAGGRRPARLPTRC
ncbi:MAG: hypothetical protein R3D25_16360 [Geminicoccaceae bacterium]